MAFWALFNWQTERDKRQLLLAAALTGLAMGIKHQGLATIAVGGLVIIADGVGNRDWRGMMKSGALFAAVPSSSPAPGMCGAMSRVAAIRSGHSPITSSRDSYGRAPVILASMGGGQPSANLIVPTLTWLKHRALTVSVGLDFHADGMAESHRRFTL